jgi:hypothetical protein
MEFEERFSEICLYMENLSEITRQYSTSQGYIQNPFNAPEMVWRQKNLFRLSQKSNRIVEIGFGAGHAAVIMLLANPKLEIVGFESETNSPADVCAEYLIEKFGTRLRLIRGATTLAISKLATTYPDLKFDGFHFGPSADLADLTNCTRLAHDQSIIISEPNLWLRATAERSVTEIDLYRNGFFPTMKYHDSIGRFINTELDWEWYLNHYPDLTAAGLRTRERALWHWVTFGKNENRYPNPRAALASSITKLLT